MPVELEERERKKAYLRSYKEALMTEKAIEEEIQQLRIDKMCPTIIADGMPHSSGGSDLSEYAAKIDELMEKLKRSLSERMQLRSEINQKIEEMGDETEKLVLRLRYIHCKTWEQVAVEMGYSWKQIHRLHGKALENFNMT